MVFTRKVHAEIFQFNLFSKYYNESTMFSVLAQLSSVVLVILSCSLALSDNRPGGTWGAGGV